MKDFAWFLPKFIQQYIGGLFFYIIYVFEWLFRLLFTNLNGHKAYRNISFAKEAYSNEKDYNYVDNRLIFA